MRHRRSSVLARARLAAWAACALLALPGLARAEPFIVVDVGAGTVLAAEQADRRWHPASLTKLMTVLVALRMIDSRQVGAGSPVKISKNALSQPPSKMAFPVGTVMRLDNALKMVVIKSANDIAVAVAESLSGSVEAFVAEMNREAFRLGLANTVFTNPTGLHDPAQFSSVRDIALIAVALRRNYPEQAAWFAHDAIRYGDNILPSFNALIGRFDGADGMKTGFVCASGYNQVGSATRNGRTVLGVVMGRDSLNARTEDLAQLLTEGFAKGSAVAPLAPGVADAAPPPDRRARSCPNGAPEAENPDDQPNSPYLTRKAKSVVNPLRVRLGTPDAPASLAAVASGLIGEKPVPVPTPRPDYTPPIGAEALRGTQSGG